MDLIMSIILAVMIFFVQVSAGLSIFQSMLMASTLLPMCLLLHPKKYEYGQNILAGPCRNLIKEMDKFMDFYEEMIKREKASDIFLSIGDKEMEKQLNKTLVTERAPSKETVGLPIIPPDCPKSLASVKNC